LTVIVVHVIEKCAKRGFEFYDVQGVADIFRCVPVFLLFWRTETAQTKWATYCERSWTLRIPVKRTVVCCLVQ